MASVEQWRVGPWFERIITWIIPVEFVALISWWMWQAASAGGDSWNPLGEFNVGSVVFQVSLLVLLCFALNRFVWKRAGRTIESPESVPRTGAGR